MTTFLVLVLVVLMALVVYSLIRDPDAFEQRFDEIRAFMSDFGRRTNQESVMFEFSDGHSAYFLDESEYV